MFETNTDNKLLESGIKIIAEEDRAVYEHITEGSHEGKKYQTLALCNFEFKGDKFNISELLIIACLWLNKLPRVKLTKQL